MGTSTFKISWESGDTQQLAFEVLSFHGHEAISELYEFKIKLRTKEFLCDNPLGKRAILNISMQGRNGDDWQNQTSSYNGVVFGFKSFLKVEKNPEYFYYEATLAPKLAKLKYTKKSDVFVETGLTDVFTTVFDSHSIAATDYQNALSQDKYKSSDSGYNRYSYVCQYEESDWDFLNRLLERDGVYYYFEQTETQEKFVLTDTKDKTNTNTNPIHFGNATADQARADANTIYYIESETQLLTQQVTIMNFGYEKAHLGTNADGVISCSAFVSKEGVKDPSLLGEQVIYGENFVNPDTQGDGEFLANIRAQEQCCQAKLFIAESTLVPISAGMKIKIDNKIMPEFGGEFLVIEVIHNFNQQGVTTGMSYTNTIKLIPANVQYRPPRKTPWPRIYGTMNALIDGESNSEPYPQIDGTGRYKIRLPFLKTPKPDGKGSIWVRLATPFAGNGYGMHFPLHKGTEVVLSFRDGNPDQPVIMAAVFNSEHMNVVIDKNNFIGGVILTKVENGIIMNDTKGKHSIGIVTNNNYKVFQ